MGIILITGVPGSGKTTVALKLASIFDVEQIIQTDTMKELMQSIGGPKLCCCATHQAWKFFGKRTKENIIKGFEEHSKYFKKLILDIVKITEGKGKTVIIEGVQATPEVFKAIPAKNKIGVYLTLTNQNEHKRRFLLKNAKRTKYNPWLENYDTIAQIDSFLKEQAEKTNGMHVIDNHNLGQTLQKIIQLYFNQNNTREDACKDILTATI